MYMHDDVPSAINAASSIYQKESSTIDDLVGTSSSSHSGHCAHVDLLRTIEL
jgi:hypothetical protein